MKDYYIGLKEDICLRPLSNKEEGEIQIIKLKSKDSLISNKKGAFLLIIVSSGVYKISSIYEIFKKNYPDSFLTINEFIHLISNTEYSELVKICSHPLLNRKVIQKPNNGPLRCLLLLTNRCNFHCKHCFISANNESNLEELSTIQWLKKIRELSDYGFALCFISGGEPTLRKDLSIIISEIDNYNMGIKLFTNGYYINNNLFSVLKRIDNIQVQIGLDSMNEKMHNYFRGPKNSFEKVINNIKKLSNEGIYTSVGTAINKYNIIEMMKFPDFLEKINVREWVVSSVMPLGRANENWKELFLSDDEFNQFSKNIILLSKYNYKKIKISNAINLDIIKECVKNNNYTDINFICSPFSQYITIWPNGNLGPCDRLPDNIIGNIKNNQIEELLNNNVLKNEIIEMAHSTVNKCKSCSFFNICGGACPGISKNAASLGDPNIDPIACRFFSYLCNDVDDNIIKNIFYNKPTLYRD